MFVAASLTPIRPMPIASMGTQRVARFPFFGMGAAQETRRSKGRGGATLALYRKARWDQSGART